VRTCEVRRPWDVLLECGPWRPPLAALASPVDDHLDDAGADEDAVALLRARARLIFSPLTNVPLVEPEVLDEDLVAESP
jgi:hypothetical protein